MQKTQWPVDKWAAGCAITFTFFLFVIVISTYYTHDKTYEPFRIFLNLPLTVFVMATYFKTIPRELIEAAVLDGASIYQIFARVAAPLVANGLVMVALVQFFFLWNDLLFSLT